MPMMKLLSIFVAAGFMMISTLAIDASAAEDKAADAERRALAEKYVNTVSMKRLLEDMVPGMSRQMAAAFMQSKPDADPKIVKALARDIAERFTTKFQVLIPKVTKLTADLMTTEELRAVIRFYDSPTGKSLLAKRGKMNEATMQLVAPWVQREMPGIVMESIRALEKKGMKIN